EHGVGFGPHALLRDHPAAGVAEEKKPEQDGGDPIRPHDALPKWACSQPSTRVQPSVWLAQLSFPSAKPSWRTVTRVPPVIASSRYVIVVVLLPSHGATQVCTSNVGGSMRTNSPPTENGAPSVPTPSLVHLPPTRRSPVHFVVRYMSGEPHHFVI